MPWMLIASCAGVAALVIGTTWSIVARPSVDHAAAALDEAVGLKERVSSSLYLAGSDDPFDEAVCADAAAAANSVTVRQHFRMRWPNSATSAVAASLVALGMFLVPHGLFESKEEVAQARRHVQVERTRVEVKKRLEKIKKMAKGNPAMSDLKDEIDKLEAMSKAKLDRPEDLRHEGIKKIDHLADAIRQKQSNSKYDKVAQTKKMLRSLKEPRGKQSSVQKLTRELAAGDFKTAKQTLEQMREQLATLKKDGDKEFTKNMQKQLTDLAKQLENLANQKQLKKKLEQAGIKKEDVERMLQKLTKEDLEQIKKQLQKNGLSQKQIEKLAQQCKKQQAGKEALDKLSQKMKNAGQAAGAGQMDSASSEMQAAAEQLSEMEALEQEMNQLDSTMADLQSAKNDMNNSCKKCSGTGKSGDGDCSSCNGSGMGQGQQQGRGGGQGRQGQGRGGLARKNETAIGFKIERGKVETTKGRIIGQFLVDGEQVKGEASEQFVELMAAAERDAIDTVNGDRIPRQYQKAVREYFKRLPKGFDLGKLLAADGEESAEEAGESAPGDGGKSESGDDAPDASPSGDSGDASGK